MKYQYFFLNIGIGVMSRGCCKEGPGEIENAYKVVSEPS